MTETTFENYQQRAARTMPDLGSQAANGTHMALGITTEIGKTFRSIKNRFYTDTLLPYNYKVVKVTEGTAKEMSNLEKKLQKEHKDFVYLPKINFDGMQECFTNFKNN